MVVEQVYEGVLAVKEQNQEREMDSVQATRGLQSNHYWWCRFRWRGSLN